MTSTAPPSSSKRRLAHHRRAPISPYGRRRRRGERGYTMVMTALLLVPLMGFTGLAVDVGSWYARAAQIQRAADAAALAGAARMPDFATARTVALDTAEKNGFVDGGDISIQVERAGSRRINVTIADSDVARYFSSLFVDDMSLTRDSLAEFVLPVPLGSPENTFGNVPSGVDESGNPTYANSEDNVGLWGNIHGGQSRSHQGDRYAAGCRPGDHCGSSHTNQEYRGYYWYAIDIPPGAGQWDVEIYDANFYPGNPGKGAGDSGENNAVDHGVDPEYDWYFWYRWGEFTTVFEMYSDDGITPAEPGDATPMFGGGAGCRWQLTDGQRGHDAFDNTGYYEEQWRTLCSGSGPGRYWLKVSTENNLEDGANRYAVRVNGPSDATISAHGTMSMFNNELAVNPEFYLAEVDELHKGKEFVIDLYDPGEIGVPNAELKILAPDGSTPPCDVDVYSNPTDPSPASQQSKSSCSVMTTNASSSALHNGELLKLFIDIPTSYSCASDCWWKVLYDLGGASSGNPSDVTTWSAVIRGDPVHLVEEDEDVAGG